MFYINIEQLQINGFFVNNVLSHGIFSIGAIFDVVPGKQFFIILKNKLKFSQAKQLFHYHNLKKKHMTQINIKDEDLWVKTL